MQTFQQENLKVGITIFRVFPRYFTKTKTFTMRQLLHSSCICALALLVSCSNNDEPEYPIFMQPSAITATDANGQNQSFEYDDYGRIVDWTLMPVNPDYASTYTAHYSYPDDNTIHIVSEELWNDSKRCYEETIQLVNGRASKSEGTFISYIDGNVELRKTYRLEFEYTPSNNLNVVKHSEVVGIGDDIKDGAWEKPWAWENYLIWEDGNLKEFEDYQGNSSVSQTTKYDYSIYEVDYPVVIPMVINSAHHLPLFMKGIFGLNSVNLVKSSSVIDRKGNISLTSQYSYVFEQARIVEYTETNSYNTAFSNPVTYKVTWAER